MKILIGGYYGAGNLGDELLLGLLIDWLKSARHEIAVVTLDVAHTRARHHCTAIDRHDLPELIQQLSEADAFILGGGGLFQDHHQFTITDLHAYPAPGISYYAQLCLLARQAGVPYMLFTMGVGPLSTNDARDITREIFQHATYASVRDQASATLLEQIGVTAEVEVGADPAWLMPKPKRIELWQRFPHLSGRRIAVVVPREWPFAKEWRESLAQGLAKIANAGWAILWLPFQASTHGSDIGVTEELGRQLDPRTPQAIAHCASPEEAAQIIAAADVLVAMRLHALIFGLKNGVPTVAVEYDDKLATVADAFQLESSLRLRLTDPASRYCTSMETLIGLPTRLRQGGDDNEKKLENAARHARETLLAAIREQPDHTATSSDWRNQGHNWILEWTAQRLSQAEKRSEEFKKQVDNLAAANARLASRLDDIQFSVSWRMLSPLRATVRTLEILHDQGSLGLMRKIYHALSRRTIQPLRRCMVRRKAEHHLQEILRDYSERTTIVFPPIVPWNLPLFQRPHQLARELAAQGYLYFFCVPIGSQDHVSTFKEVDPGCFITPYADLVEALPNKIIHLYSTDNTHTLEWVRTRLAQGDKVLYEYVDEIHEDISGRPIPSEVWEKHRYLLRNEEITCVATANKLYQDIRAARSLNCGLVTNGADIAHFAVDRDERSISTALNKVTSKGKPIVGYFGALAKWLDYELVASLAIKRPDYEIVLIGPDYDGSLHTHHLDKFSNVTLLGPVDYKLLPAYACWFDVATIPFRINEITESTSPIKLFEYMALGHPIVTTDMPECRKYRSVLIGKDVDHFIEQVDRALNLHSDSSYQQTLRKEAEENSWSSKAAEIDRLLRHQSS